MYACVSTWGHHGLVIMLSSGHPNINVQQIHLPQQSILLSNNNTEGLPHLHHPQPFHISKPPSFLCTLQPVQDHMEYYPVWNFPMYLDWALAVAEYQLLVTEEYRKRVCAHPTGKNSTALQLFGHDVTGCLNTVFGVSVVVWNGFDSSVLEHFGRCCCCYVVLFVKRVLSS